MGFKLVGRVYELGKDLTSPSEQAVLLALDWFTFTPTRLTSTPPAEGVTSVSASAS